MNWQTGTHAEGNGVYGSSPPPSFRDGVCALYVCFIPLIHFFLSSKDHTMQENGRWKKSPNSIGQGYFELAAIAAVISYMSIINLGLLVCKVAISEGESYPKSHLLQGLISFSELLTAFNRNSHRWYPNFQPTEKLRAHDALIVCVLDSWCTL